VHPSNIASAFLYSGWYLQAQSFNDCQTLSNPLVDVWGSLSLRLIYAKAVLVTVGIPGRESDQNSFLDGQEQENDMNAGVEPIFLLMYIPGLFRPDFVYCLFMFQNGN
jgi:hypothetical protein